MPWVGAIWLLIIIARLLASLIDREERTRSGLEDARRAFAPRGKVAGQKGPDMRAFSGRAGRREWWVTIAWCGLVTAVITQVPVVGPILTLPWVVGALAVTSRRLHDMQRSAWLQAIPLALVAAALGVFFAIESWSGAASDPTFLALAVGSVSLAFCLWVGLLPGTRGPNCYGEADAVA